MPRLASLTSQSLTGITASTGLKLIADFAQQQIGSSNILGAVNVTGLHMGVGGVNLQLVGSNGTISQYITTGAPYDIGNLALDDTFAASASGGINWDNSGRNMYYPTATTIDQYSVLTGDEYSITNRLAVVANSLSVSGVKNMLIAPDDTTVLIATSSAVQLWNIDSFNARSISNAVNSGTSISIANLTAIAYYDDGNYLLAAKTNGDIDQIPLNTAYSIVDGVGSTVSTLSTGLTLTGMSLTNNYLFLSTASQPFRYG